MCPKGRLPFSTNNAHSSPQPASPLLRLPGEIRNRIYEYVFSDHRIWPRKDWHGTIKLKCVPATRGRYNNSFERFIALTKTCRQIREETRLLPFKYCDYQVKIQYASDYVYWMDCADQELREVVWARLTEAQRMLVKVWKNAMRTNPTIQIWDGYAENVPLRTILQQLTSPAGHLIP